jgi:hypothetical protein
LREGVTEQVRMNRDARPSTDIAQSRFKACIAERLAFPLPRFGLELGKSVSIPECAINPRMKALGSIVYEVTMDGPEIVCFQRYGDPLGPGEALGLEERVIINFPKSKTPELLVGGSMDGKIMGGTLVELSFFTAGAGTERFFLRALKQKYGPPSSLRVPRMQTIGGARVDGMDAVWNFATLRVTFESALQNIDQGSVVIQTGIAIAREAANLPNGPKL